MDREEIIRMARGQGLPETETEGVFRVNTDDLGRMLAAERNKLAAWMMAQGYSTGHGDNIEDLLKELEWQIDERVRNEREAIAKSLDKQADLACDGIDRKWAQEMAAAVRARGNT